MMFKANLAERAKNIRLPHARIGELTRPPMARSAVTRALNVDTDPRSSTTEKIAAVIEAEELRLRDELIALHGIPRGEGK